MADFSFVVNSSYDPFTLQEMLVPMAAYKEAYDKAEKESLALSEKANTFSYLSRTLPEGSEARQAYENYAKDLEAQAKDFSQYGYYRDNADALTSLKRRYSGEIGGLVRADEALKKAQETRAAMNAKDNTLLYGQTNLTIDDFYNGRTPNMYNVSGAQLYAQGVNAGKAASSRVVHTKEGDVTLGGYYRDFVQEKGFTPETIEALREDIYSNPELAQTFNGIKQQYGIDENLTGAEKKRADASIFNGIIDGIIHEETHNPVRDLGVLSAKEKLDYDLAAKQLAMAEEEHKIKMAALEDKKGKGKVAAYNGIHYINNGGAASKVEEVDSDATKVNINLNGNNYEISIGEGDDKVILGTLDQKGNITVKDQTGEDLKKLNKHLSHGTSWTRLWSSDYDEYYDKTNVSQLITTVRDVINREGAAGTLNYNFYLFPDNASRSNQNGGFFIESLDREEPITGVTDITDIDYVSEKKEEK